VNWHVRSHTVFVPDIAARALDMPVAKVMQVVRASREAKSLDTPVDQSGSADAADSPALVDTLAADLGDAAEDSSQRCGPH
jgi:DNA-directed RNA polymerase sigma subunit (sigma70/sigma32)